MKAMTWGTPCCVLAVVHGECVWQPIGGSVIPSMSCEWVIPPPPPLGGAIRGRGGYAMLVNHGQCVQSDAKLWFVLEWEMLPPVLAAVPAPGHALMPLMPCYPDARLDSLYRG